MAYAFDKIMEEMEPKANVFGDAGGAAPGGQPGAAPGVPKTSTEGDLGPQGGSGGGAPGQAVQTASGTFQEGLQRGLEAAGQRSKTPKALDTVSGRIAKADSDLQAEADSYRTSEKGKFNYDVSGDLDAAIGGSKEAQGKVSGLLSRKEGDNAGMFDPKTQVVDVDFLDSDTGLMNMLRSQSGPTYTAGQAAFDLAALKRAPGFHDIMSQVKGKAQDLGKKIKDLSDPAGGVRKEVEDYGDGLVKAAQERARAALGGRKDDLIAQNAQEARLAAEKVQKLKADPEAMRAELAARGIDYDKVLRDAIADASRLDPALAPYLEEGDLAGYGVDPLGFVSTYDQEFTGDMFFDDSEAARFNAIMGMLGEGGVSKVPGSVPELLSFDGQGYGKSVIDRARGANAAADDAARQQIQAVMGRVEGMRSATQDRLAGYKPDELISAQTRRIAASLGISPEEAQQMVNAGSFYKAPNPADFMDPRVFLSAGDASILNNAYGELMDPTRVSAGAYGTADIPGWEYDSAGYTEALKKALAAKAAERAGRPVVVDGGARSTSSYGGPTSGPYESERALRDILTGRPLAQPIKKYTGGG